MRPLLRVSGGGLAAALWSWRAEPATSDCDCDREPVAAPPPGWSATGLQSFEPAKDVFHLQHGGAEGSSFSLLYDAGRRSPKWVVEHLRRPESAEGPAREESAVGRRRRGRPAFHTEPAIDVAKFRTNSALYKHSGFDRG